MAIPLDIEEILGSGCADAVKRVFAVASSLWLGTFLGGLCLGLAEAGTLLAGGHFGDALGELASWLGASLLAVLWGFLSPWGIVMGFLLMASLLYFVRSEGGSLRGWTGLCLAYSACVLLGWADEMPSAPLWLAWVLWLPVVAAVVSGAFVFHGWQRNRIVRHFTEVAAENEARRRELQEEFENPGEEREEAAGVPVPDFPGRDPGGG